MNNFKKSQMSIIESVFMIMLFVVFSTYYSYDTNSLIATQDYTFSIDSAVNSIYYSDDYRNIIFEEDLLNSTIDFVKWDSMNQTLSNMFYNFELVITDDTGNYSKTIFECKQGMYNKLLSERMFFCGADLDNCNFRVLRLGVCY